MAEQPNSTTLLSSGSSSNIPEMSSSTPIRIGSSSSSFHGTHDTTGTSNENRPVSADTFTLTGSGSGQQSNSMPNAATLAAHMTANNNNINSVTPTTQQGSSIQPINTASGLTPPNSAGLRLSGGAFDFKFIRRTSSKVFLPRLASSDSLSNSPGPATPGLGNWASDSRDKSEGNQNEKTSRADSDATKLNRKESYKAQRKNYRREKKRVASELLNSLQDPAVIVLADWLKVRGTLKSWTKLWCVLKPGHLLIYKSPKTKSSHWVGTILLTSCQVIERPSKKDGFCFKLFHPLEQSIWAPRGPDKETIGAVVQPLPTTHLIFRAPSQAAGKCWMDALELSLRCSALLLRSNNNMGAVQSVSITDGTQIESQESQWSEADYEKHFNEHACEKRYSRYLTPPDMEGFKSHGTSDTSNGQSRSQTPIMQQLYITITNWERMVAHASDFNKIKNISKLVKGKSKDTTDHDFSDISSVENSPSKYANMYLKNPYPSVKLRKRNEGQVIPPMLKAISLDTNWNSNQLSSSPSFSDGDDDDNDEHQNIASNLPISDIKIGGLENKKSTVRPVSAPPFMVKIKEDLDADSHNEGATAVMSDPETDTDSDAGEPLVDNEEELETPYEPVTEDFYSESGEQVEVLGDENKSLIWILLKQVRPGMDLSKVVLPTFILEPRSFLDKLSDSYFHADILSRAVTEDDPFTRMKTVVQWYLSGFYKKPKGLKKPYNPIIGEVFRCYWEHPNGSRTFYIAEQVSHHPPISAFYVTNRQDGFCISCSILAKSKFYGNSTSAVLEGIATLTLLPRGENYTLNTPYAHCKGILMGTLSMELGGKIMIECEKTGYRTELEFKLKPMLGGSDSINSLTGKIKLGKETLANIHGHWDREIRIKDVKTGEESVLFAVTNETKQKRLKRYMVPLDSQLPNESERLWQQVSRAIVNEDQVAATQEKTILEEAQRNSTRERLNSMVEWIPKNFQLEPNSGQWVYKYADLRPWDPRNDVRQYESNYKVLTKTKHKAPIIRTASVVSGQLSSGRKVSDSSLSPDRYVKRGKANKSYQKLLMSMDLLNKTLVDHSRQLAAIQLKLDRMQYTPHSLLSGSTCSYMSEASRGSVVSMMLSRSLPQSVVVKTTIYFFVGLFLLVFLKWLLKLN